MSSSESSNKPLVTYINEPPIDSSIETFFANYASIPASALRDHLITIRERAWKKFNYPCLGRWGFLDFSIQQSPIYEEIVKKCKNEGATVIDFGCCLGQDVRQLVYDGVPHEQIRGYELDPFFIEQGYQLFRDGELMREKKVFSSGDIFDDRFLETVEPADYLYAGLFIHLFDGKTQKDVCRRLSRLCKGTIAGQQAGASSAMERPSPPGYPGGKRMCHSPESFAHMWNEVTDGRWQVESSTLEAVNRNEYVQQMLTFVVKKKAEQ